MTEISAIASEPGKSDHSGLLTGATLLGVLGMIGAVGKWGLDVYRARVIALTDSGRRALDNAEQLVALVRDLPDIHRDLFDQLLVAQAMIEPLRLVTADGHLAKYTDLVIEV